MSKLYTAISRLDELAIRQETHPAVPDIPFGQAREDSGSSVLRMLVLSGALILFGIVAVGFTAWWQDWFDLHPATNIATPLPPELPPDVIDKTKEKASPPVQAAATTPLTGEFVRQSSENDLSPALLQRADQQPFLPESILDNTPTTVISRLPAKAAKKVVPTGNQHHPPAAITIEPKPLQLVEQVDAPATITRQFIDQTAQLSRWLHQAEQRRRAGDWNGAIALFTKVWEISGNPAVANNLAASLIQVDRLSEAEKILTKALQQAPGDQDLQQNLRVAQQLADK